MTSKTPRQHPIYISPEQVRALKAQGRALWAEKMKLIRAQVDAEFGKGRR
jgi:hypothetical protein